MENGDLINRQMALDAIRAMQTYKLHEGDDMLLIDKAEAQTELMLLPSAQPEPTFEQIKEYCYRRCMTIITNELYYHLTTAYSAQPEYYDYSDIDDVWEYYAKELDINLTDGAKQIKDAMWVGYRKGKQDAQPERKKGRWAEHYSHEDGERDGVECSECRTHYYFGGQLMNYCPNCGAQMEETT